SSYAAVVSGPTVLEPSELIWPLSCAAAPPPVSSVREGSAPPPPQAAVRAMRKVAAVIALRRRCPLVTVFVLLRKWIFIQARRPSVNSAKVNGDETICDA